MKRVLITGATRGIGRAMVEEFSEQGYAVLGCGRSQKIIEELCKRFPAPHHFATLDVTEDSQVELWKQELLAMGPAPDLLLNNAAIINSPTPLWQVEPQLFSDIIDVNIKGVANLIRHWLPAMMERGSGVIVNFSSGWGRSTAPGMAPYCATKWAIEGLSQALAQDLPAGMAAVALSPGVIHTEMLETCFGKEGAARCIKPREWSRRAVPFLMKLGPKDNGASTRIPGL
ncbi:MAG: SDR family oxidoreductase [Planctomycetota bacterium]